MKNQNLIVSRERLDDHKYMVFISIYSLCRLKHELKDIFFRAPLAFTVHLLLLPLSWNIFQNSFSERYKLQFEIKNIYLW